MYFISIWSDPILFHKWKKTSFFVSILGFIHEHQRPDRDEYIDILYENLANDRGSLDVDNKYNLDKQRDFPYDFCSVAHYSRFTASRVSTYNYSD